MQTEISNTKLSIEIIDPMYIGHIG